MMNLNEDGDEIDVVTLMDQLTKEGTWRRELSNNVPTTRNIQYYTNIVANHALKRRLIQTADSIANDGYDNELELDAILSDAERRILELSSNRQSDGFKDIRDVLGQVYETVKSSTKIVVKRQAFLRVIVI